MKARTRLISILNFNFFLLGAVKNSSNEQDNGEKETGSNFLNFVQEDDDGSSSFVLSFDVVIKIQNCEDPQQTIQWTAVALYRMFPNSLLQGQ